MVRLMHVMLGRLVKDAILLKGLDYPMGKIAPLMREADLVIVNLECAITNHPYIWSGAEKAFYFGAPPQAAEILASCGVKMVSLANNHILDFDRKGLLDTLCYLNAQNIAYAGAGKNAFEAYAPAYVQVKKHKFGMSAFCDHQQDFQATDSEPGMAYLNLDDTVTTLYQFEQSLHEMQQSAVDWPILSLHWGPNQALRPAKNFIFLAHTALDMGYKLIFGHSAHVFQGIEIYRKFPIIYAAGDLVDDYYVDPRLKNDHQLLIELEIAQDRVSCMQFHPVFIRDCQTVPANEQQTDFIATSMQALCAKLNAVVQLQGESLISYL